MYCLHCAQEAYERLTFREALKSAAYDLGNARDVYRFACGPDGMHRGLVERYIEVGRQLVVGLYRRCMWALHLLVAWQRQLWHTAPTVQTSCAHFCCMAWCIYLRLKPARRHLTQPKQALTSTLQPHSPAGVR